MRQTGRLYGVLCFLSVLMTPFAYAAEGVASLPPAPAGEVAAPVSARILVQLQKMQSAAQRLDYSGSFVYRQASLISPSRVTHILVGKNELEKREVLDGKPREYLRNNEDAACYLPEAKAGVMERRVTLDVFPAILDVRPEALDSHYQLSAGLDERVAGTAQAG